MPARFGDTILAVKQGKRRDFSHLFPFNHHQHWLFLAITTRGLVLLCFFNINVLKPNQILDPSWPINIQYDPQRCHSHPWLVIKPLPHHLAWSYPVWTISHPNIDSVIKWRTNYDQMKELSIINIQPFPFIAEQHLRFKVVVGFHLLWGNIFSFECHFLGRYDVVRKCKNLVPALIILTWHHITETS